MATATTVIERLDRVDPWGFGDAGGFVVVAMPPRPGDSSADSGRPAPPWPPATSLAPARDDAPGEAALPASEIPQHPPAPDLSVARPIAVPLRPDAAASEDATRAARDTWALRLPFAPQRIGVLALFAAILVAQAFYLGVAFTGAAASAPPTGDLVLSSHPSGVRVTVDGRPAGTTPLALTLPAGRRIVTLEPTAGVTTTLALDLAAGKRLTQHVPLVAGTPAAAPRTGVVQVDTGGTPARIGLDSAPDVAAPAAFDDVAPGEHRVTIKFAAATVSRTVTVPPDGRVALVVDAPTATPPAPAGPVSGWVRVDVPFEVQVFEDGRLLGTSAADRLMLAAGRHDLVLANATLGYRVTVDAAVAPGRLLTMTPPVPTAAVDVNASPWAEVFLAGRSLGDTPLARVPLPLGEHTLVFRHPDLGERTASITVRHSAANRVAVAFAR